MEKDIILFDIDKTMINPSVILKNFENRLIELKGIKEGEVVEIYKNYIDELKLSSQKSTDFDPSELIKRITENKGIKLNELNTIFYSPEVWKGTMYFEVKETLDKLKELGKISGICSEGITSYQLGKLRLNGIEDSFDKNYIFIKRRKLDNDFINTLPTGLMIVDDNKEVVERLKAVDRFNIVWINRNNDEEMEGVETIKDLSELIELIESRAA